MNHLVSLSLSLVFSKKEVMGRIGRRKSANLERLAFNRTNDMAFSNKWHIKKGMGKGRDLIDITKYNVWTFQGEARLEGNPDLNNTLKNMCGKNHKILT